MLDRILTRITDQTKFTNVSMNSRGRSRMFTKVAGHERARIEAEGHQTHTVLSCARLDVRAYLFFHQ